MANFRSSGLLDGLRSVYGARIRAKRPMPGMVTPATIGWNIVSSSWRPRKYQGAFDGFGVWLMLARAQQRGVDHDREDEQERRCRPAATTNSTTSRWGHTWTLSSGDRLDVLDRART